MVKNIYLDELLKKYIVPTEMRDNSIAEGGKLFTSGSRIPLKDNIKFVRLFTAWATKSGKEGLIDVDLGGAFVYDDKVEYISYFSQSEQYAVHSGDYTSCREYNPKEGRITAEYIDIDIERCLQQDIKYVLIGSFIFSRAENWNEFQCYSGVQLLSELRTERNQDININNNLFKMKLVGDYQSHIPLALDLETKEIVIIDKYQQGRQGINVSSMNSQLENYKRLYFNATDFKENVYDFLELYIESNSDKYKFVETIEESDIVCSYNNYDNLEEHQEMFNIANNLESILNLLN